MEARLFGYAVHDYLDIIRLLDEYVPGQAPLMERLERLLMQEYYAARHGGKSIGEERVADRLRRSFEWTEKPTE